MTGVTFLPVEVLLPPLAASLSRIRSLSESAIQREKEKLISSFVGASLICSVMIRAILRSVSISIT